VTDLDWFVKDSKPTPNFLGLRIGCCYWCCNGSHFKVLKTSDNRVSTREVF